MLEQTRNLVKETMESLQITENFLKGAEGLYDDFNRELRNAKARLKRKQTSTYPERLKTKLIKSIKDVSSSILIDEIEKAVKTNQEFQNRAYLTLLYAAANDKDTYKLIYSGSGWLSTLTVLIELKETAGDLNDWARGVTLFREELKTKTVDSGKGSRTRGRIATSWWLTHVYGNPGLMFKTVMSRAGLSNRTAPFWQILNNGSTTLASDRGDGSFNPVVSNPTNFVGQAEERIRLQFSSVFIPEKVKWEEEISGLSKQIEISQEDLLQFRQLIRQLTPDKRLNNRVINALGLKKKNIDPVKLTNAIKKYRAGEEFENPTIELTKAGASGRARLSVRRLEGVI